MRMLDPATVRGLTIGAVAVGGWFAAYAACLLVTRPREPQPGPPTQDFGGPEPPAVVSLLVNGWEVTEDAVESTLIDLAARRFLEFRQPGADPVQTTIHLRHPDPAALATLNGYERRVYDRVVGLAVNGVVPLTALTFRNEGQNAAWWKRMQADVVADARRRGLSQPRLPSALTGLLVSAAMAAGAAVGIAVSLVDMGGHRGGGVGIGLGFVTFALLTGLVGLGRGERDTAGGREVAGRWLGLRAFLRGDESFADLPPAAVAVWDRYLSYGDAVGATRVCSAVIDLGMGDRRRVWSSFGGSWHRVRVSYPHFWGRYGQRAVLIIVRALGTLVLGALVLRYQHRSVDLASELLPAVMSTVDLFGTLLGVGLLARGGYRLVRAIVDIAAPVTFTGEVLWEQPWKSRAAGENRPAVPWLYHLAVDDGSGERSTAWALPSELYGSYQVGDVVRCTVRRWSRRVLELTVVAPGSAQRLATAELAYAQLPGGQPHGQPAGAGAAPSVAAGIAALLSAQDVARAVGRPVTATAPSTAGPMSVAWFRTVDADAPVVSLVITHGIAGRLLIRALRRATPLPGIGEEAYARGGAAAARLGDLVVTVTVHNGAISADPRQAPLLLSTAVSRIPGWAAPQAAPGGAPR